MLSDSDFAAIRRLYESERGRLQAESHVLSELRAVRRRAQHAVYLCQRRIVPGAPAQSNDRFRPGPVAENPAVTAELEDIDRRALDYAVRAFFGDSPGEE
jgi:hypothetical protein